ncbi:hsp20/alpha crystallin family protein [Trifolium pratense]|uniref:Uncharacterized protein n=2 Tax=Trifolium pratense TaxID=57577 RepID=A0ACB0K8X8_TRIPR|nr:inactive protein RESTRICTED TEV MOVEMENT 2-like [Trifolium pratense]XP_045831798.1 inactive protein RESTRICTED TEV MOVEMENT 2-like [Trifolium pratense]PNY14890.1 hsp20/alpha crystallin family protein [Trifolium pratense]CAJ2653775.1 unnamed protein product [Trifolium pratense]
MSFDQKTREADRIYDEFEPPCDWDHEDTSDTLILMLPGFKKEQLRVQVTSTRVLRVSGERQTNEKKWRRFRKEVSIPPHSDTSSIGAKFEAGILYIKLPKLIKQQNIAPTPTPTPAPIKPTTQEPQKPQQQTIPQKPNNAQVSDQKKQVVQQEPNKDIQEDSQKKGKGKVEEIKDDIDDVNKKVESKVAEKRSLTLEMVSKQRQEYMNALSGLVDEVKKQKKLVNLLLLVFLVLLFGLYVKSVIKSFFSGGHERQEL